MKLRTLIAALSVFAAAAFMTACSDDNDQTRQAAPKKEAANNSAAQNQQSAQEQQTEKYNKVRPDRVQVLEDLKAIADNQYTDRCTEDEMNKLLKLTTKRHIKLITSMNTSNDAAQHPGNAVSKVISNSTNRFCGLNLAAAIASGFGETYLWGLEPVQVADSDALYARGSYLVNMLKASTEVHNKHAKSVIQFEKNADLHPAYKTLAQGLPGKLEILEKIVNAVLLDYECADLKEQTDCTNASEEALMVIGNYVAFIAQAKKDINAASDKVDLIDMSSLVGYDLSAKHAVLQEYHKSIGAKIAAAGSVWRAIIKESSEVSSHELTEFKSSENLIKAYGSMSAFFKSIKSYSNSAKAQEEMVANVIETVKRNIAIMEGQIETIRKAYDCVGEDSHVGAAVKCSADTQTTAKVVVAVQAYIQETKASIDKLKAKDAEQENARSFSFRELVEGMYEKAIAKN